ncbi:MAG: tetratricopeptide repeat protein [Planctomycetota bacterium]|jgi:Flp pilus assembly protein TadD
MALSLRVVLVLVIPVAVLAACSTPAPVEPARVDADRAFARGAYAEAEVAYGKVADRYPGDWRAQYRRGVCLLKLDRPAEARRALEIAHTRRPKDEQVSDALAEAIFRQGDASRLFAFVHERAESTQTVDAWLRMGRYAAELGDPDSAKMAFETAIVIDDGQTVYPYLEAAAFAERIGDMELAVRRLRQAYGVDPRDPEVRRRLEALGEVPGPTVALPSGR